MVRLSYVCPSKHEWEKMSKKALDGPKCPECGEKGEILWTTGRSDGFLRDAVLVFRNADGTFAFPGRNDAKTPPGAERMELRKLSEVRAVMRDYNRYASEREERKEDRFREIAEQQQSERRKTLHHLMGQETDAAARDLYREALRRAELSPRERWREYYNESVE